MEQAEPPLVVPLWMRLVMLGVTLAFGSGLAEGVVRIADDGALPHLDLYTVEDGRIALEPDAFRRLRRLNGDIWELATGPHGLRVAEPGDPPASSGWLVVGDSQPLGLGVDVADSFAARLDMANAGVPSHGVVDALSAAEALAPELGASGIVVVLNQANDWEDGLVPAPERGFVVKGWLLNPGASTTFWASPLPRLHLLYYASLLMPKASTGDRDAPPAWMADPEGQAALSGQMVEAIRDFQGHHPELRVITAFLPVDVAASADRMATSAFAARAKGLEPWHNTALRDQVLNAAEGMEVVDLLPVLADCASCFLDADYHLSPEGHARVAEALGPRLAQPR